MSSSFELHVFCNLDKYTLKFGQIHFTIWKKKLGNLEVWAECSLKCNTVEQFWITRLCKCWARELYNSLVHSTESMIRGIRMIKEITASFVKVRIFMTFQWRSWLKRRQAAFQIFEIKFHGDQSTQCEEENDLKIVNPKVTFVFMLTKLGDPLSIWCVLMVLGCMGPNLPGTILMHPRM